MYDETIQSSGSNGIEPFTSEQHFTYPDLIYLGTNVRFDLGVIDANEHIIELPRNLCEMC